jgi:hypothetical protein
MMDIKCNHPGMTCVKEKVRVVVAEVSEPNLLRKYGQA